ncbi:uncharacterized protein LOC136035202 isoform X2 [Artemia franciscana]|uniref:Uncharacterized protein n=1 Tax=Artemia franciscana TaxID=6661 RepID=A0AA88I165_ARTSF|nr:hypothetical protein QYM36_003367 [Artemia franciscana]
MHMPHILNMAGPITIPETTVVKNEVEEVLLSGNEELFDFPDHLLSPKIEDIPVGTSCCLSGPCKLEPDTQELGSICFDNEEVAYASLDDIETIRGTCIYSVSREHQQQPLSFASRISNLTAVLDSQDLDYNDEEIVHSTLCSSDGMDRPKLFGPKPIVKVKKLTENAIEEINAGIWLACRRFLLKTPSKSSPVFWLSHTSDPYLTTVIIIDYNILILVQRHFFLLFQSFFNCEKTP